MSPRPEPSPRERLFVALDSDDPRAAYETARSLAEHVGGFKIGLELYSAWGPSGIDALRRLDAAVFCDLKLHDIPNTVERAAAVLGSHGVSLLTVHTLGGAAMMQRAVIGSREGAERGGHPAPCVLGVTILTSHDRTTMRQIGLDESIDDAVARLGTTAIDCLVGGLVCSASEVASLRDAHPEATLVVPGIRPRGLDVARDDQSRTATPAEAVALGADVLVVGRPITTAADPIAAATAIVEELERG